ncbi:UDP-galactose 4-epimerase [Candidatus Koribacter versatilis Ellin345]|uniref:UDP-glucose 4-epimerase n=1 Tax=Koribacter versatilis (strain Ellin345) TaxID=204669 RepID=Q1IQZ7_KORVE|nr:UDP-glucose 4-epimerase GalE [Candidatus Koribacter versatilis]ABF40703.1 UDP-galactose 4-epimerase [Candidatus Koribacter versatilis Ellin345]
MKVLVTGGAGYIGSVVAAALVERGHSVVVYDNLSNGHRAAVPSAAQVVAGDIGDRAMLDATLRNGAFDGVMHFAAFIEAGESMRFPERFFRNNTANTLTLLELMLEHRVSRFVFSSTAALYGNPERTPIEESDPLKPTNAYGESKLLVERMLEWFHSIHGLCYASLRYFNAAGATATLAEDHHPESHLIPIVLEAAAGKRDSIAIHGTDYPTPDGTCVRDYIHVSDLADAHLLALERLGRDEQPERLIYNLGNGHGSSVLEVIEAAKRVTGNPIQVKEGPRRAGDPEILVASSQKIRKELGWSPKYTDIDTIIESAWRWRNSHPKGYGDEQ